MPFRTVLRICHKRRESKIHSYIYRQYAELRLIRYFVEIYAITDSHIVNAVVYRNPDAPSYLHALPVFSVFTLYTTFTGMDKANRFVAYLLTILSPDPS